MRHALLFLFMAIILFVACTNESPRENIQTPTPSPQATRVPLSTTPQATLPQSTPTDQTIHLNDTPQEWGSLIEGENFWRKYEWEYDEYQWEFALRLYNGIYQNYKERNRHRDYDLFASDPGDDAAISEITGWIREQAIDRGYPAEDFPRIIASFVQSLPYTSDKVTAGFDEYARYPYETLYDNGGDCEDTSILVVSMLQELGYDAVLILLPDHMAAGVECGNTIEGAYYTHNGKQYCYLETTGANWPIGKIPDEYVTEEARILDVKEREYLQVTFNSSYSYRMLDTKAHVNIDAAIRNLGSKEARNVSLYVAIQARNETALFDERLVQNLNVPRESSVLQRFYDLKVPRKQTFRVALRAFSEDAVSEETRSEWATVE